MTEAEGRLPRTLPGQQADARASGSHDRNGTPIRKSGAPAAGTAGAGTASAGAGAAGAGAAGPATRKRRLVGIDAARGVALIGMVAIHILPAWDPETFEPTVQWTVFAGRSAALFALLAGVGLAFGTGGRTPHTGRTMRADRVGVAVRALLIAGLGLAINEIIPGGPDAGVPAVSILVYYGAFFLLALPFLHLGAKGLFACAAFFALAGPVLVHTLRDVLPEFESHNPTFGDLLTDPGATAAQLLLTGTFPALPYLAYLLAGLAIGRLELGAIQVQARLVAVGTVLAVTAWLVSRLLIAQAGGFEQLVALTPGLDGDAVTDILVWGPDPAVPTTTWWWLAISGPYTNTPFALLLGASTAVAVLGTFLLLARGGAAWLLPLSAMGSMTLTLYSAHLLGLSTELHYDQPAWFFVHVAVAMVFALTWQRIFGQGPLERLVARIVRAVHRRVQSIGSRPA